VPQIEITNVRGQQRVVPVQRETFLLGSGDEVDLCLTAPGIDAQHLRFVGTRHGYRVEPVRPGATVQVNGDTLYCKDLEDGDTIAIGGLSLRWVDGAAARPVPIAPSRPRRSSAGHEVRAERPVRRVSTRSRGVPTWIMVSSLMLGVALAALIAYRGLAGSTWPQSPQHYVDLARSQLANQQMGDAEKTLDFALRDATGATRDEALLLQSEIRRMQVEGADLGKVQQARTEHDNVLMTYVARWLRDTVTRPEAREFVRLCDDWLLRHGDVCRRHSAGKDMVAAVEELRSRHRAAAAPGEPETAEDVLFAASTKLRWQVREYKSAFAVLDRFLGSHPDDAAVRAERARLLTDGRTWLQGRLGFVENLVRNRNLDAAAQELAQLDRHAVVPEWEDLVRPLREQVQRETPK
jgi:hypothetical protein